MIIRIEWEQPECIQKSYTGKNKDQIAPGPRPSDRTWPVHSEYRV